MSAGARRGEWANRFVSATDDYSIIRFVCHFTFSIYLNCGSYEMFCLVYYWFQLKHSKDKMENINIRFIHIYHSLEVNIPSAHLHSPTALLDVRYLVIHLKTRNRSISE